jgi:hypothetical protein
MRPELPDLAREITLEIRERIPEYARLMEDSYGPPLRAGVQRALTSFFDVIADPFTPREQREHLFRRLGQYEALEGRSLDSLQAACRIGAHVGWRRVMDAGLAFGAPAAVMSQMADAVLGYMDELATQSRQGYLKAKARSGQSRDEECRRLLHLILERPQPPRRAIDELAELTGWSVPEEVTLVAVEAGPGGAPQLADAGILADLAGAHPCLLIPGPADPERRPLLEKAMAGRRAAVGLTVPLADATQSLRWARRALSLIRAGIIRGGGVAFCEDHMVTLWLMSDEPLLAQLARRQFGALDELTPLQRQRLTETFATWLETGGTATEVAHRLKVHPQTVRYRMRKLQKVLDVLVSDSDARFALELVLRAARLREQAAFAVGGPVPVEAPRA